MKKVMAAGLALVVLTVAGLLIVPSLLDWTDHRDSVASRLAGALGVPVTIGGELEIGLLPRPVVTVHDLQIGEPADPAAEPQPETRQLSADTVEIRLAWLPFLTGTVEVQRAVLVNPRAEIVADRDLADWAAERLIDAGDDPEQVRLGRLTVENGEIHWRDRSRGVERRVTDIHVQMTAEGLAGPFGVIGSLAIGDVAYMVDLATGRLTGGGALPARLALGVDGLAGELRVAGLVRPASGSVQGELAITGADPLAIWHRFADASALPEGLVARPGEGETAGAAVSLEGGIEAGDGRLSLDITALSVGQARGRGTIDWRAEPADGAPHLDVDLSLSQLVADTWTEALDVVGLARHWLDGHGPALPADLTTALDLRLPAAVWRGEATRSVRLTAASQGPTLTLERLTAEFPGGSEATLSGTLTAERADPSVDLALVAASGDLGGLLAWAGVDLSTVPPGRLGSLAGQVRLAGRPQDWQLMVDDLMLDGSHISGGLAWRGAGRPGFGLRLVVDQLDLDSYHADGAAGLLPALPDRPAALARLTELAAAVDANIEIQADRIALFDHSAERLSVDATLDQGRLILRRLGLAGLDGLRLAVEGQVAALDRLDGIALQLSVDSERSTTLTDLFATEPPLAETAAEEIEDAAPTVLSDVMGLMQRAGDMPFSLTGQIDGGPERLVVVLSGGLAGGRFDVGGAIDAPWRQPNYDLAARAVFEDGDQVVGLIAPDYQPREPLGVIDLYAQIAGPPAAPSLEDIRASIGDLSLAGRVAIDRSSPRRHVDLDLRAGVIALQRFLPAARATVLPGGAAGRWSREPLDLSLLRALDADIRLTAAGLRLGDEVVSDLALRASLGEGELAVTGFDGELFGGRLGLTGRLIASEPPQVELDASLIEGETDTALASVLGLGGLTGELAVALDVVGEGGSLADLVGSLDGSGLVTVSDGWAEQLELARIDRALAELEQPVAFLSEIRQALAEGRTRIQALNAGFDVVGGIARTESLRIVTPVGRAEGRGLVDLADRRLDISTDFSLFRFAEAPPVVLHLFGPLTSPVRRSQTQALQAYFGRRAAEALAERFGDLITDPDRPLPIPGAGGSGGGEEDPIILDGPRN